MKRLLFFLFSFALIVSVASAGIAKAGETKKPVQCKVSASDNSFHIQITFSHDMVAASELITMDIQNPKPAVFYDVVMSLTKEHNAIDRGPPWYRSNFS